VPDAKCSITRTTRETRARRALPPGSPIASTQKELNSTHGAIRFRLVARPTGLAISPHFGARRPALPHASAPVALGPLTNQLVTRPAGLAKPSRAGIALATSSDSRSHLHTHIYRGFFMNRLMSSPLGIPSPPLGVSLANRSVLTARLSLAVLVTASLAQGCATSQPTLRTANLTAQSDRATSDRAASEGTPSGGTSTALKSTSGVGSPSMATAGRPLATSRRNRVRSRGRRTAGPRVRSAPPRPDSRATRSGWRQENWRSWLVY